MLTGYGQEHDRRLSLEAGFDAHIVKPVDAELLFAAPPGGHGATAELCLRPEMGHHRPG